MANAAAPQSSLAAGARRYPSTNSQPSSPARSRVVHSGRAQITAARAKCEERGARSNRIGVHGKSADEDNDEHDGDYDERAGPIQPRRRLEVGQLGVAASRAA